MDTTDTPQLDNGGSQENSISLGDLPTSTTASNESCPPQPPVADSVRATNVPGTPQPNSATVKTTAQTNAASPARPWWKKDKFNSCNLSIAIVGLVFVIAAFAPQIRDHKLNEKLLQFAAWTAKKDFKDECRGQNETYGVVSQECRQAIGTALSQPPKWARSVVPQIGKRHFKTIYWVHPHKMKNTVIAIIVYTLSYRIFVFCVLLVVRRHWCFAVKSCDAAETLLLYNDVEGQKSRIQVPSNEIDAIAFFSCFGALRDQFEVGMFLFDQSRYHH